MRSEPEKVTLLPQWPTPPYGAQKPFTVRILRYSRLEIVFFFQGPPLTCPQSLVEQVVRLRIWESAYWKEECFALTGEHTRSCAWNHGNHRSLAVSLIDKAIKLNAVGGVYDNTKPTQFICLLLKLLQIQPEKEILVEYLLVEEFKYALSPAGVGIYDTHVRYGP